MVQRDGAPKKSTENSRSKVSSVSKVSYGFVQNTIMIKKKRFGEHNKYV